MSAGQPAAAAPMAERLGLGAALLASTALVWFATGEAVAVAGYVAGLAALGAIAWFSSRSRTVPAEPVLALPDWSVTVAAINRSDAAIAITDRAGRLVCANPLYEKWFTTAHAPPRLSVDNVSLERLAKAARSAWRDGSGSAENKMFKKLKDKKGFTL